jgi:16S rRNA (guanine966-N2)-methyltransferase
MSALRVISGTARGRRLVTPAGHDVRPTADRVKEALFSALGIDAMRDARVLDGYAGSGALAIEALSRGAAYAFLIDADARAYASMTANVTTVGFEDRAVALRSDLASVLGNRPVAEPFDYVFLDPPYDTDDAAILATLAALTANGWLAPDARIVVERAARSGVPALADGWRVAWERTYGSTLIAVLEPPSIGSLSAE